MNKIEAVVFDMDGLMFDTEKLWLDSVIKTNEVYGYKVPTEVVIECMGRRKDFINQRFKEANLSMDYFEYVIGGDMVTNPKPDPMIYIKSCEVLDVNPENAIALEDSEYGIISAYKAGMKPILIPDIKCPSDEVVELTYKKLKDLSEVIDILK